MTENETKEAGMSNLPDLVTITVALVNLRSNKRHGLGLSISQTGLIPPDQIKFEPPPSLDLLALQVLGLKLKCALEEASQLVMGAFSRAVGGSDVQAIDPEKAAAVGIPEPGDELGIAAVLQEIFNGGPDSGN